MSVAMATASCVLRAQTSLSVKCDCTSCAAESVYPLISPRFDKSCPKRSPVGLHVMLNGMALWRWHFWWQMPVPVGLLRFAHSVNTKWSSAKQIIKWFNGSILDTGILISDVCKVKGQSLLYFYTFTKVYIQCMMCAWRKLIACTV